MVYTSLVIGLLHFIVIVESKYLVACYNTWRCQDNFVQSTINDCCDHRYEPPGLGYSIPGIEGCQVCPKEFGFFNWTFSGIERKEPYSVQVGTISGPSPSLVAATISLVRLTAGNNDVDFSTTVLTILPSQDPQPVSITFIKDSVAQEVDETFMLTMSIAGPLLKYRTERVLYGIILDDDIAVIQFSENDYRENERPNARMPVRISKQQNMWLANPVTLRVSPLTVAAALRLSLNVPAALVGNPDSPVQADEADFNTTVFEVTMPADEGSNTVTNVDAFISIVDDEINENTEQIFIVFFEVLNATNPRLIDHAERYLALCRILDNDPVIIGFERTLYSIIESAGYQEVCVAITNPPITEPLGSTIMLMYTTVMGSADGDDFMTVRGHFGFDTGPGNLPEARRMCVEIGITNDSILEDVESFTVFLRTTQSGVIVSPNVTEIRILDDDVTVSELYDQRTSLTQDSCYYWFIATSYTVNENDDMVTVAVAVLNGTLQRDVTLVISTSPGSALDGSDYTGKTLVLIFSEGMTFSNVSIPILDDDNLESDEEFFYNITTFENSNVVMLNPDSTVINILDNDG